MTEEVGPALRGLMSSTPPLAQMMPAASHAAARSGRLERYLRTSDVAGSGGGLPLARNSVPAPTASGTGASATPSGNGDPPFPRVMGVIVAVNRYPFLAIVSMYCPLSAVSPSALRSANTL